MDNLACIDDGIRPLVAALRAARIDTDWSCEGTESHMSIRPIVQARVNAITWQEITKERDRIEAVLHELGYDDYWLSLMWKRGAMNTHGNEPVWLIEIAGRFDWIAIPVSYCAERQSKDDLVYPV